MKKPEDFLSEAMKSLDELAKPSPAQKQKILENLLRQVESQEQNRFDQLKRMVTIYPWRFGFGVSAVQTVICTLLFGSNYANFILQLLGR